jgi:hypothetical protein
MRFLEDMKDTYGEIMDIVDYVSEGFDEKGLSDIIKSYVPKPCSLNKICKNGYLCWIEYYFDGITPETLGAMPAEFHQDYEEILSEMSYVVNSAMVYKKLNIVEFMISKFDTILKGTYPHYAEAMLYGCDLHKDKEIMSYIYVNSIKDITRILPYCSVLSSESWIIVLEIHLSHFAIKDTDFYELLYEMLTSNKNDVLLWIDDNMGSFVKAFDSTQCSGNSISLFKLLNAAERLHPEYRNYVSSVLPNISTYLNLQ